ncbi:hypothetical protein [Nocardioides alcanivorans]|uniref:hypothetical protein n=1 Tax=Nocardioides alcanivorans TaxID=2897352 RepID=UPI001F3697E0|nr:hypothetical protein [Nocardioides alcanivorans]
MTFTPDQPYRVALGFGGLLALLLLVMAALAAGRETWRRNTSAAEEAAEEVTPDEAAGANPRSARRRWVGWAAVGFVLLVVGGPWSGLGVAAAVVLPTGGLLAVAAGALAVAGVAAAWALGSQPDQLANGAAALGVGLLVGAAVRPRLVRLRRPPLPPVDRLTAVALLLVAGQALLRGVLAAGSWFWQDDFRHLFLAHELGFTREFLVRDYSGHLEIGQYVVYWLISGTSESFGVAAAVLVMTQALASILLWTLLRTLFPRSAWLLVPFTAYLFTPLGLITGAWFAAGLQALPLQVFLLATLLGLVRMQRDSRHQVAWGTLR